jgi:hypothetical protein
MTSLVNYNDNVTLVKSNIYASLCLRIFMLVNLIKTAVLSWKTTWLKGKRSENNLRGFTIFVNSLDRRLLATFNHSNWH